jgi:hypothetical protein
MVSFLSLSFSLLLSTFLNLFPVQDHGWGRTLRQKAISLALDTNLNSARIQCQKANYAQRENAKSLNGKVCMVSV